MSQKNNQETKTNIKIDNQTQPELTKEAKPHWKNTLNITLFIMQIIFNNLSKLTAMGSNPSKSQ